MHAVHVCTGHQCARPSDCFSTVSVVSRPTFVIARPATPRMALDRAVFELSEKLRHPSDIRTKLTAILESTKEEYEAHAAQFKSKLLSGYSRMSRMQSRIGELGTGLESFNENKDRGMALLRDFTVLIKDYKTIKTLCNAHQNFLKIKSFVDNLKEAEYGCKDEDLEKYHGKLYDKEEFCCELEQFNYDLEQDDFSRIETIINTIKRMSFEFTALLVELVSDFTENAELFEKIGRILEMEEKRDEITRKAREGENGDDVELKQYAKMYPRYILRKPKNLRDRIIKTLRSAIQGKFSAIDASEMYINQLGFIESDLEKIHQNIHFDFFDFNSFLLEYHRNLKDLIDQTLDRLDAGEILALIEFKTEYYNNIEARYNKVAEALGKPLLENESVLLEKYSLTASEKLGTWIENITASELEKFSTRDPGIGRDEDGKLISSGFISLLQIIKTQLEPISFNRRVFLHITETVKTHCNEFKNSILRAVEKDFYQACKNKSKTGFEDYYIMFGNSGLKLTQYITSLPQCQSPEVRELSNIFIDILKACNYHLAEYIIVTCNSKIQLIFTDEWINSNPTQTITVTIKDFLDDYYTIMSTFSFTTFISEVCGAVVAAYFKRCKAKTIELRSNSAEALKRDYHSFVGLFSDYIKRDDVKEALEPLMKLVPVLESTSEELIKVELEALKLADTKANFAIIKNILQKRTDLSEEVKKDLIAYSKELFGSEKKRSSPMLSRLLS